MKPRIPSDKVEYRYTNWLSLLIDMMKPTNLYVYGGRGLSKSTEILAKRSVDVIEDMPLAPFAFVADTYVNLMTNILPHIFIGWDRLKFYENYHYVIESRPPDNWPKPIVKTLDFKHTLTTYKGSKFFLKSLDRPSINAGISVVHQFGDEGKYLQEEKLIKFFPTLRGDLIKFGKSHYYLGQTFVSDMPDPNAGESDWMSKMAAKMDKKQVMTILQAARVVNEIYKELYEAQEEGDTSKVVLLEKQLDRWSERLRKIRTNSTLFFVASSFVNADVLTLQYFENLLSGDFDDFKLHVLSMKRSLDAGSRFYAALSEKHFYPDGYDYDYYDASGLKSNITQSSKGLKYVEHDQLLEAGFDGGNMMSLVIGQEQGKLYRVLKNMYTLAPESIRELANQFIQFFEPHKKKYLLLYHDRATSQYERIGRDMANQLKHDIEYLPNGSRTGWVVELMSRKQGNILHPEKYHFFNVMMAERVKELPRLAIDQWECRELKVQLQAIPTKMGKNKEILKDKRTDHLKDINRLPLESTNLTDAFDYLLCRKKWMAMTKSRKAVGLSPISIR